MKTTTECVQILFGRIDEIKEIISNNANIVRNINEKDFNSNNGCTFCWGTGIREYGFWDDKWSGNCDQEHCTPETRERSGINFLHYGGIKFHPMYKMLNEHLEKNIALIEKEIEALNELNKNDVVVVIKGRKVPKGLIGKIFWKGQTQFGERLGIKDEKENVHWIDSKNVARALTEDSIQRLQNNQALSDIVFLK